MSNNNYKRNKSDNGSKFKNRGKYTGKGSRKTNSKKQSDNMNVETNMDSKPGDVNNPAYYYNDANVLTQVMNFSFNEFGGVPMDIQLDQAGNTKVCKNSMVAAYYLNPSIPQSSNGNAFQMEGVTTAALRNYLALSGSNAKTTNYAPQDVVLLTLAIAELIKVATFLARAFGVAYLFNYRNRSYPETLLLSMGIDVADFNLHLAEYRVRYNKLLAVASKIPFPADIPLFRKAADLYGSMYLDDDNSALAQTYMFAPYTTWLFDEQYDANGSGLKTLIWSVPNVPKTMNLFLNSFESMISALINSTSLNAIYSDIMRLVQNGKITSLITFNSIPENFIVTPVYNEEIKDWIHNAIIMGYPLATSDQYYDPLTMEVLTPDNDISCVANTNKVLYHPQFKVKTEAGYSALLDFDHDGVTVEDKVKATRLAQRYTTIVDSGSGDVYTNNLAFADEYVVCASFWSGGDSVPSLILEDSFVEITGIQTGTVLGIDYYLSKFDWAPLRYWIRNNTGGIYPMGDLDYYTQVDYTVLKKIYDYEIIHLLQLG